MHKFLAASILYILLAAISAGYAQAGYNISISSSEKTIGVGRSVTVQASVTDSTDKPVSGLELHPYRNGKRWGPHEFTDIRGKATFIIPIPTVGKAEIAVAAMPEIVAHNERWIWAPVTKDNQTVYLSKKFELSKTDSPTVWFAVDDGGKFYLNGELIAEGAGWTNVAPIKVDSTKLRTGTNYVSVEAHNGTGPGSILFRLDFNGDSSASIFSDGSWNAYYNMPEGWPGAPVAGNDRASVVCEFNNSLYGLNDWPNMEYLHIKDSGSSIVKGSVLSNKLMIEVKNRKLETFRRDENRLIGMQWEEWFTPLNNNWSTAQAIPLMGYYSSFDREAARQHLIWFIESGIDFILVDWSNNIWFLKSWDEVGKGTYDLDKATKCMMDVMAEMAAEGYVVPKVTFLIGISHVRPEGPNAVKGQLQFIWDNYVADAKYKDLWQYLDGKPLIQILDLGASYYREKIKLDDRYAIRYTGSQQDTVGQNKMGFWTWMDRIPVPTMASGYAEALTVNGGSFGHGGWKAATARGHRGGATLVEDWELAMKYRPRFLAIHQFNEFAGQLEGHPASPPDVYVDSYSAELCDDLEPTSLNTIGYRGQSGWGYLYLNMTKALVDLYKEPVPKSTVLAIALPLKDSRITNNRLDIEWRTVGAPADSYTVYLNGKAAISGVKANSVSVDISKVRNGKLRVKVRAENTRTRYVLHHEKDAVRLKKPVPAESYVDVTVAR